MMKPNQLYCKYSLLLGMFLILGVVSCVMTPPMFDEDAWQQAVAGQSTEMLYAPHVRDGVYFNPWMPMQSDRFAAFLKWRFSKKGAYTDEEETFLPMVQPELLKRLDFSAGKQFAELLFFNDLSRQRLLRCQYISILLILPMIGPFDPIQQIF